MSKPKMAKPKFNMDDWEIVKENPETGKKKTFDMSDWEKVEEPKEEGFFKGLPRDIAIGLTHAGRNLHNLPHDIVQGVDVVGSGIGRMFGAPELQNQNSNLASYLPNDTQDYSDVFGQNGPPSPIHNLVQKGVEYAPDIIGGLNALRGLKILPHLTKYGATRNLNKARDLASQRDIGTFNVNPELIEDARQFLPNLLRNRNELNASHAGDYNSLFKLQSDVGKISSKRMGKIRSLFSPESNIKGEAGLEARKNLLNDIHSNLQEQGHHDISDLLRKGQDEYRRYMNFKKYRDIIGGAAAAYAIPKNPLTDLLKKLWTHGGQ